jgi:hypothetical protein
MTPNGAVIFTVVMAAAAMLADLNGLLLVCGVVLVFAAIEIRSAMLVALRRSALLMLPLAAFMIIVWVGIIGRSPAEIAANLPGSRAAALTHVTSVSLRLFIIAFVLQAVTLCFRNESPYSVVRALCVPLGVKRLLVLTLSLVETLRHAVGRSHTALVSSGIITRRHSLRNLCNGWILIQSVWLTAITTVVGRMRDKWPTENTLSLLEPALAHQPRPLITSDFIWMVVAAAAIVRVLAGWTYGAS